MKNGRQFIYVVKHIINSIIKKNTNKSMCLFMKKKNVIIIILVLIVSLNLFARECGNMAESYKNIFAEKMQKEKIRKIFDFQSIEDISQENDLPLEGIIESLKEHFADIDETLSIRKLAKAKNISCEELKHILNSIIDRFNENDE